MFQLAAMETGHIIIGVVTLMATLFIAYYVARMMKGKVEIEIPKAGYNSGEEIVGKVTFTSRKNLHINRFYVALIGYEIVERRDSDGDRSTRRHEIYRAEHNLAETGDLAAGAKQSFGFTLVAPGNNPAGEKAEEIPAKVLGAVNTATNVIRALGLGNKTRRLEWKLEARADLPGVDIASSTKIRVNLI